MIAKEKCSRRCARYYRVAQSARLASAESQNFFGDRDVSHASFSLVARPCSRFWALVGKPLFPTRFTLIHSDRISGSPVACLTLRLNKICRDCRMISSSGLKKLLSLLAIYRKHAKSLTKMKVCQITQTVQTRILILYTVN